MFNLFGENEVLRKISDLGDPLEKLDTVIDWEFFRPTLTELLSKEPKGKGGRPHWDYVLMFKILILQRLYNLSDDQTEKNILDRLSFRSFLRLDLFDAKIPDAKTIWQFKNELAQKEAGNSLFELFEQSLEQAGVIKHEGTIVDASFVEVPKQRNKREENKQIKAGEIPDHWSEHKKSQKDTEARWTKKGNQQYFGYKNSTAVDQRTKLIKTFEVIPASTHDSQSFESVLTEKDRVVYADSAYVGQEIHYPVKVRIIDRAYKNKPLSQKQKKQNYKCSKTRCRVEHVYGFIENSMGGSTFRGVGHIRATFNVAITNLVYNLCRFEQILRLGSHKLA